MRDVTPIREPATWRLRSRSLNLGTRTVLMGIVNVTPDSFSDGGQWLAREAAVAHALQMLDQGADIVDVGGESTRPNAVAVSAAEEQDRVLPVLQAIVAARPDAILSIDTYHSETARLALQAGAEIVNDVSGHLWDPAMSSTCAELGAGVILMHTWGRPQEWRTLPALAPDEVVPLVLRDLAVRTAEAISAGIPREAIVLDPGFGFGKSFEENMPLLAEFHQLHSLGNPLLAGISRKGFLRKAIADATSGVPDAGVLADASIAAHTAAILSGAHILRVHEILPARAAAAIADGILHARDQTS